MEGGRGREEPGRDGREENVEMKWNEVEGLEVEEGKGREERGMMEGRRAKVKWKINEMEVWEVEEGRRREECVQIKWKRATKWRLGKWKKGGEGRSVWE